MLGTVYFAHDDHSCFGGGARVVQPFGDARLLRRYLTERSWDESLRTAIES